MMVNKKTLALIILLFVSIALNVALGIKYWSLKRYHDRYFRFVGQVKGMCAGNPWPWSDEDADLLSSTRAVKSDGEIYRYENEWWAVWYDDGEPIVEIELGDHHKLIVGGDGAGNINDTVLFGADGCFQYRWNEDGTLKTPSKDYYQDGLTRTISPEKIQEASEPDSGNEGDQPKNGTQNTEQQNSKEQPEPKDDGKSPESKVPNLPEEAW